MLIDDDEEGNVKIGDFGLAKLADIGTASFGSCHTGNARWLPPELLIGINAKATYESDIYSFGCVWLEVIRLLLISPIATIISLFLY